MVHTLRVWPVRAVVNVCPLVNVLVVMAMPGTTWYCRSCSIHKLLNAQTAKSKQSKQATDGSEIRQQKPAWLYMCQTRSELTLLPYMLHSNGHVCMH